jgi:uncharacterized protein (DUF1499 family)
MRTSPPASRPSSDPPSDPAPDRPAAAPARAPARRWVVAAAVGLPATLLLAAAALLVVGQLGGLEGRPPLALGVVDGRLAAPSATANSVSSQADAWPGHPQREAARIAPLPASGDAATAMARLRDAALALPGATLAAEAPGYLRIEYRTRWLRFVDDAEFWFDPAAGVVHVRSASRLGQRDLGVNRARIEAIRGRLAAAG